MDDVAREEVEALANQAERICAEFDGRGYAIVSPPTWREVLVLTHEIARLRSLLLRAEGIEREARNLYEFLWSEKEIGEPPVALLDAGYVALETSADYEREESLAEALGDALATPAPETDGEALFTWREVLVLTREIARLHSLLLRAEEEREALREFYEAHEAVERGILDFDLHAAAVERLRMAQAAMHAALTPEETKEAGDARA